MSEDLLGTLFDNYMILAVITLSVSVIGIVLMFYIKTHEIKTGGYTFCPGLRATGDIFTHAVLRKSLWILKVITNRKFWFALLKFLAVEFKENVLKHEKVIKITKKVSDVVHGRKKIEKQGKVSFYLQDISEYKKDLPKE